MCACLRDKVIETYIGVQTLEEKGVLMCSCVGVCGRDRKRRVVHKETKVCLFVMGVVCEVSAREPQN